MENFKLSGLGVALVTPFKKDLTIDYSAFQIILDKLISGGADYLVVLGTTAETPTLSKEEKHEISRFVKNYVDGRIPLVIGIGGNNTLGVVKEIQNSDLDGYSAILSVAPYYNKPTQEGLFLHFQNICDASPLPVLLYNVPSRTGVNITADTCLQLAHYSSKICGVKEASGNISQIQKIIKNAPENFRVISGNDSDTYEVMKAGGVGVISVLANAFPSRVKTLVELCSEKKYEEASEWQDILAPITGALFEDGNPSGVKAVMADLGLIENLLRLPLVPVSSSVEKKLKTLSLRLPFSNK